MAHLLSMKTLTSRLKRKGKEHKNLDEAISVGKEYEKKTKIKTREFLIFHIAHAYHLKNSKRQTNLIKNEGY